MKMWAVLPICAMLVACASAPVAPRPDHLFKDALFEPATERISADDVLAISAEMKQYLNSGISSQLRAQGPQRGLIDALYNKQKLKLEYDAAMTRNAAQAFEARAGNCLSLVIMTAAFAKELGLPVTYQSVLMEATWSRNSGLYFSSGHVNLVLGVKLMDARDAHDASRAFTIDFLPPDEILGQRTRVISEATVLAMYMNNRAAETLAKGYVNEAYWWARAAVEQAPTFFSSVNTLAVIYLRHGDLPEAEAALNHVLAKEPANTQALSNLAIVLDRMGRAEESGQLLRHLAQIEPYPPYHYFNLGIAAVRRGDYQTARDLFRKEIDRAAYDHEFHFWLAIADLGLGDVRQAREHLTIAMDNSTTRSDHDLYAAKLNRLKSLGLH